MKQSKRYAIPLGLNLNSRKTSGSFCGQLPIPRRKVRSLFRNPPTNVQVKYYKNSDRNRSPATFQTVQPNGVGTRSHATIMLDPVLKARKNRDLKRAVLRHEKQEIDAWEVGSPIPHIHAKSKEGKLTQNMQYANQFWEEEDRRNRR